MIGATSKGVLPTVIQVEGSLVGAFRGAGATMDLIASLTIGVPSVPNMDMVPTYVEKEMTGQKITTVVTRIGRGTGTTSIEMTEMIIG